MGFANLETPRRPKSGPAIGSVSTNSAKKKGRAAIKAGIASDAVREVVPSAEPVQQRQIRVGLIGLWKNVFTRGNRAILISKEPVEAPERPARSFAITKEAPDESPRTRGKKQESPIPGMMEMAKKYLDEVVHTKTESSAPTMLKSPSELTHPSIKITDRRRTSRVSAGLMEGKMEQEMVHLHQAAVSALQQNTHVLIQFTGSLAGEGTSTIAKEFARVSSTKFKKKTLLFDADWRQAALRQPSRRTDPVTIERAVRHGLPLEQALACIEKPLLFTCLLSADPEFCPDLYDLPAMKRAWSHLKEAFDVVVVDSPPAADYQDSAIVAKDMDGVILVLKADSTKWPIALNAKQEIADNGGNILGMALNDRRFHIPEKIYRRL